VAEGKVILPATIEMMIPGEWQRVAEFFVGMLRLIGIIEFSTIRDQQHVNIRSQAPLLTGPKV